MSERTSENQGSTAHLLERDQAGPKQIAFVGDTILDVWHSGAAFESVDLCPSLCLQGNERRTPGGTAGAARQLDHWHSTAHLLAPASAELLDTLVGQSKVNVQKTFQCPEVCTKHRFLGKDGKLLFRADREAVDHGLGPVEMTVARCAVLTALEEGTWDAIALCDYDKGFLDNRLIRDIIEVAHQRKIPIVADPKRDPHFFEGCILKVNEAYWQRWQQPLWLVAQVVCTRGVEVPLTRSNGELIKHGGSWPLIVCRNHVGAGDCFLAHLALCLAHGYALEDAARVAHQAGRNYVTRLYGEPPSPDETR